MREVGGYDYGKVAAVARWPLWELLYAYRARLRAAAAESYRTELIIWAILSASPREFKGLKKPVRPRLLKDEDGAGT